MLRASLLVLLLLSGCASAPAEVRRDFVASDFVGSWVFRDRRPGNHEEITFNADGTYCRSEAEGGPPLTSSGRWEANPPGHLILTVLASTDPEERVGKHLELLYTAHFEGGDRLVLGFECTHCELAWPYDRSPGPRRGHGCAD